MGECTVQGVVTAAKEGLVTVEVPAVAACSACGGKMLCGTGDGKKLHLRTADSYQAGDLISLSIKSSHAMLLAFTLYAAGAFAAVLAAAVAAIFFAEIVAVAIFFIVVIAWIPIAGVILNKRVIIYESRGI
jgi:positive regulator of sigma E activity